MRQGTANRQPDNAEGDKSLGRLTCSLITLKRNLSLHSSIQTWEWDILPENPKITWDTKHFYEVLCPIETADILALIMHRTAMAAPIHLGLCLLYWEPINSNPYFSSPPQQHAEVWIIALMWKMKTWGLREVKWLPGQWAGARTQVLLGPLRPPVEGSLKWCFSNYPGWRT